MLENIRCHAGIIVYRYWKHKLCFTILHMALDTSIQSIYKSMYIYLKYNYNHNYKPIH